MRSIFNAIATQWACHKQAQQVNLSGEQTRKPIWLSFEPIKLKPHNWSNHNLRRHGFFNFRSTLSYYCASWLDFAFVLSNLLSILETQPGMLKNTSTNYWRVWRLGGKCIGVYGEMPIFYTAPLAKSIFRRIKLSGAGTTQMFLSFLPLMHKRLLCQLVDSHVAESAHISINNITN